MSRFCWRMQPITSETLLGDLWKDAYTLKLHKHNIKVQ